MNRENVFNCLANAESSKELLKTLMIDWNNVILETSPMVGNAKAHTGHGRIKVLTHRIQKGFVLE